MLHDICLQLCIDTNYQANNALTTAQSISQFLRNFNGDEITRV